MNLQKQNLIKTIESLQEKFWDISDAIWGFAELGLEEYQSSKLLADTLESAGFDVKRGVAGMPTAFIATWQQGTGSPRVGFLAEYDALPGLSQKPAHPVADPVVAGAPGHGCGHNTMGAMQALAVISLKNLMQENNINGALKYFGSPGEEILVSRPFMIRAGLFEDVDLVLDCHSHSLFKAQHGMTGSALLSFIVTFKGKTAHSGSAPWLGRNAANAVELMHAGTERMKGHLLPTQRVNWVTLEAGQAPNVTPDRAVTWYFIRGSDENIEEGYKWVRDCANGAALMTQTTCEIKFLAACHQRFGNKALAEVIYENMKAVAVPAYTQAEVHFAERLQKNANLTPKGIEYPLELINAEDEPFRAGASDVGDVTLTVPTATIYFPAQIPGCRAHHWSVVASSNSSFAHKGITAGAKVAALSAYDLMVTPRRLKTVRDEFELLSKKYPYRSFLPDGAQPPLGWYRRQMERYRNKGLAKNNRR